MDRVPEGVKGSNFLFGQSLLRTPGALEFEYMGLSSVSAIRIPKHTEYGEVVSVSSLASCSSPEVLAYLSLSAQPKPGFRLSEDPAEAEEFRFFEARSLYQSTPLLGG